MNGTWSFGYDALYRLATASASSGQDDNPFPNLCWSYDNFGNRTAQMSASVPFSSGQGGSNTCSTSGSLGQNVWAQYNGTVNGTGNNQMSATSQNPNQGQSGGYDASGNIANDGLNSYLYDAEGRVCAVASTAVPGMTAVTGYIYDGDGNRVAKGTIPSATVASVGFFSLGCDPSGWTGFQFTADYVLGTGGEELTEMTNSSNGWQWQLTNVYAAGKLIGTYNLVNNPAYTPGGSQPAQVTALHFHLEDPLGTRRMQVSGMFANLGQPETDCQSLPYGDQLNCYTDAYADPSASDATPLHYTGKERDTESANDYFEARYFGSSMGRFLSPDPLGGKLANPQSLNKYAYALNNPLVNTDPTGMYVCADSNDCSSDNDKKFAQSLADARNAAWNLSGADLLNAMNAINSYGDAGKDNGVTVGFNSNLTDSNGNPEAGETQVSGVANGTKSALNPDGQNIHVAFRPDQLTGAVGAGLVAHEGSHASDGAAWVASGFSAAKDPTHMETEFNAYHVEFNIANTILREGWSGNGFPPSYTKSGHNGSASWFATGSWDPVNSDQIKGFINANYSNLNSPAFTKGAVVPR